MESFRSIKAKSHFICFSASDNRLYVLREMRKAHSYSAMRFYVCDLQISSSAVLNLVRFSFSFHFSHFSQIIDSKTYPQPPSSKIHALPVCHMLARRSPSLLPAFLRRNTASSPSSTPGALAGISDEIPSSSLPLGVGIAKQRQRIR